MVLMRAAEGRGLFYFLGSAFADARHLAAELGAGATGFAAADHQIVVAHLLTTTRTTFADLRTCRAGVDVQLRMAQHEVRAGLADLGAIGEKADVVRFRVPPAFGQAMGQRFKADAVTSNALFDTGLHA